MAARNILPVPSSREAVALDTSQDGGILITELPLFAAIHSTEGEVLDHPLAVDGLYAETRPGEPITLEFRVRGNIRHVRVLLASVGHVLRGQP